MASVGAWRDGAHEFLRAILPASPVWGRHPDELTLRFEEPVEAGILRSIPGREDPALLVLRPLGFLDHGWPPPARQTAIGSNPGSQLCRPPPPNMCRPSLNTGDPWNDPTERERP